MHPYLESYASSPHFTVISRLEDGRIEDINRRFSEITGFSREEALGRTSVELGLLTAGVREQLLHALSSCGRTSFHEVLCGTRWGPKPMILSAEVLNIRGVPFLFTTGTDPRDLRAVEDRLELTTFMVEQALGPLCLIRSDGSVAFANEAVTRFLGYSRPDLLSMNIQDLDANLNEEDWSIFWEELRGAGKLRLKRFVRSVDGSLEPVEVCCRHLAVEGEEYSVVCGRDLREEREKDQEIRKNRVRYQQLVENLRGMVLGINRRGEHIYVSPASQRLLGYPPEEFQKRGLELWKRIIHPGDLPGVTESFRRLSMDLSPMDMEVRARTRTEEWKWLQIRGAPPSGRDPDALMIGLAFDITDRVEAEESRRELQEWQRAIVEGSRDAIFISDEENRFVLVNSSAERMTGFSRKELLKMKIPDLYDEAVWADYRDLYDRIMEGEPALTEARLRRADGSHIHVEFNNRRFEVGGKAYIHSAARDISNRKRMEREILESRERYQNLFNSIRDAIIVVDRDRRILDCNPAFTQVFGYRLEEIRGKPTRDFYGDAGQFARLGEELRANEVPFRIPEVLHFRRKSGEEFLGESHAFPLKNAHGETKGFVGISRDVSREKELEQQLFQAQKLETLGELAGGIAHDFNNLLVPIMGYSDLVESGVPADDPLRRQLEKHLFQAAEAAKELVAQILTFSRKDRPHRRALEPSQLLRQTVRMIEATLPSSITLELNIPERGGSIYADPSQIRQVILNLCTNAVQAMKDTGGHLFVGLEEEAADSELLSALPGLDKDRSVMVLTVSDEGEGIPPSNLTRIFDPFFTTKGEGEGTGLGLSVVYGIVTGHGGAIRVESREGEGTRFILYFPTSLEEASVVEMGSEAESGPAHILFVDDKVGIRETGRHMLEALGYTATVAESGHDALKMIVDSPEAFDVVITDQDMPSMTGVDLARELSRFQPRIPVILMSGSANSEWEEGDSGIRALLAKPFTSLDLSRAIRVARGRGVENGERPPPPEDLGSKNPGSFRSPGPAE